MLQGNYSDLLVQLSNIYSQLRGDVSGVKNEDSSQAAFSFVGFKRSLWLQVNWGQFCGHFGDLGMSAWKPHFAFFELDSPQKHHILSLTTFVA